MEDRSNTPPDTQSVETWSTGLPSPSDSASGNLENSVYSLSYKDSRQAVRTPRSLRLAGVLHPKGQKVLVRSRYDGFYYPGTVEESSHANFLRIILVDRSILEAQYEDVVLVGGAETFPLLRHGDPALVRVRSSWGPHRENGTCDFYIPGRVCSLPDNVKPMAVAYSVLAYNRVVVTCPRRYVVKICESMHSKACKYITAIPASAVTPEQSKISASFLGQLMERPQEVLYHSSLSSMGASSTPTYRMSRGGIVSRNTTLAVKSFSSIVTPVQATSQSYPCLTTSHETQRLDKVGGSHYNLSEKQIELCMTDWRGKMQEKLKKKRRVIQVSSPPSVSRVFSFEGASESQISEDGRESEAEAANCRHNESNTNIEEVLCNKYILVRCSRSGWYYRAIVKQSLGESWYEVFDFESDDGSNESTTYRVHEKDIVFNCSEGTTNLEMGKTAISALYPRQECFVPGIVMGMSRDGAFYHIQFHNGMRVSVLYVDVFPMDPVRYDMAVEFIKQKGVAWLNTTVIAKMNEDGLFPQGKIIEEIVEGSIYKIEWESGESQTQHSMHIFGDMTKSRTLLRKGDFILAPRPDKRVYIPAVVKYQVEDKIWVKGYDNYCHWVSIKYQRCFWLSSEYYYDAVDYISLKSNLA